MKSGFVSIIGKPNSGKSSLINRVIKDHIAITSKKAQTTRKNIRAIYNDNDSQIVFIDTPGIHEVRDELDKFMEKSINIALKDVDLVVILLDIVEYKDAKEIKDFIDNLSYEKNIRNNILICFNKIDLIDEIVLESIKNDISKYINDVVYISCLKNKNIENFIAVVKKKLNEGVPYYPEDDFTDTSEKEIVKELIREQILYKIEKEIPHGVYTTINSMKFKSGLCIIDSDIVVNKENHKSIIIGKNGSMLKNIGYASRVSIEKFLNIKVYLQLHIKVKKDWKNNYNNLKEIGYDIKSL